MKFKKSRLVLGLREFRAWRYIVKTCKRESMTKQWNELGLRVDWVGRIYTVINLANGDIGESNTVKNLKIIERTRDINKYLESLGFVEIVSPFISPLCGQCGSTVFVEDEVCPKCGNKLRHQSYLVIYSPLFRNFTLWYLIKFIIVISALVFGAIHFLI